MKSEVTLTTIYDDKVVAVKAECLDEVGIGHSICHELDRFDLNVGVDLATGRALQHLASHLRRRANVKINARDEVRTIRDQLDFRADAIIEEREARNAGRVKRDVWTVRNFLNRR